MEGGVLPDGEDLRPGVRRANRQPPEGPRDLQVGHVEGRPGDLLEPVGTHGALSYEDHEAPPLRTCFAGPGDARPAPEDPGAGRARPARGALT